MKKMSNSLYKSKIQPISDKIPTKNEMVCNESLVKFLHENHSIFETSQSQHHRHSVIQKLHQILVQWAESVGISRNLRYEDYNHGGNIQLHIFGSTKLGVNTIDADIDVLCLAPSFITKLDFFQLFSEKLKEIPEISMLTSIPDAYTPVIKFYIENIAVDMIFVSLTRHIRVPANIDVLDDSYLDELDEASVRSLNGVRVAESIIRLVPNFNTFCMTLRAIKHWARQRGIYSNVLGYLGGVNCAILVAHICQLYPRACPAIVVQKFFMVYSTWRWNNPVLLCPIQERPNHISSSTSRQYLPVWSRANPKDATHIMPIITPTYPAMNSSYNVGPPQCRTIIQELVRGRELFLRYGLNDNFPWNRLFHMIGKEFFDTYPAYVQVDISAQSPEDHRLWFGWVESRMRFLMLALERPPNIFSHPQANCYHRVITRTLQSNDDTDIQAADTNMIEKVYISTFFIGLTFSFGGQPFDVTPYIEDILLRIHSWPLRTQGMELRISGLIPGAIPQFARQTRSEPSNVKSCTPKKGEASQTAIIPADANASSSSTMSGSTTTTSVDADAPDMATASDSDPENDIDDEQDHITSLGYDAQADEFTQRMMLSSISQYPQHQPMLIPTYQQHAIPISIPIAIPGPIPITTPTYIPQGFYQHVQYYDEHKNEPASTTNPIQGDVESPIKFTFGNDDSFCEYDTQHPSQQTSPSSNFGINMNPFPQDFPLSMSPPTNMNTAPLISSVQFGDFSPMMIYIAPSPHDDSANGIKPVVMQLLSSSPVPSAISPHDLTSRISAVDIHSHHQPNGQLPIHPSSPNRSSTGNAKGSRQQPAGSAPVGTTQNVVSGPRRILETSPSKRSKSDR